MISLITSDCRLSRTLSARELMHVWKGIKVVGEMLLH